MRRLGAARAQPRLVLVLVLMLMLELELELELGDDLVLRFERALRLGAQRQDYLRSQKTNSTVCAAQYILVIKHSIRYRIEYGVTYLDDTKSGNNYCEGTRARVSVSQDQRPAEC